MHRPKSPTPGSTTPAAPAAAAGIGDQGGVGAEVLQRLLGRAEVADAVVEDGDHAPEPHRVPFVEGTPPPSTRTASRSARATPLNDASRMWWALRPDTMRRCRVIAADGHQRPPELLGQLRVERRRAERVGLAAGARVHLVHEVRPARTGRAATEIERLVERHVDGGEAAHARLVAERLAQALAEQDAGVLDGVVGVDFEVAAGRAGQVEAGVLAELGHHVVEERQPGRHRHRARAVEDQADLDGGLLGRPPPLDDRQRGVTPAPRRGRRGRRRSPAGCRP